MKKQGYPISNNPCEYQRDSLIAASCAVAEFNKDNTVWLAAITI